MKKLLIGLMFFITLTLSTMFISPVSAHTCTWYEHHTGIREYQWNGYWEYVEHWWRCSSGWVYSGEAHWHFYS